MNSMNITRISNRLRVALKPSALAVALAAGLAAGSVQALTTTATYQLGAAGSGTSIPNLAVLSPAWITAGTLPPGSILRSVSIDARIDTEGGNDTYANDLFVYVDPGAPPSGSEILQVGGFDALGSPTTNLTWANGSSGTLGTTCVDAKNAVADFPDTIDLNSAGLFLGSRGSITASWSGTLTVEYDVPQAGAITSFGPGAVVGELVGNAAAITWIVPYGTGVTALAPTFTLSSGSCNKDNGGPTTYDFTNPVVYTVTDGATINTYTVTVTVEDFLQWSVAGDGDWDLTTSNWLAQPSGTATTFIDGKTVVFDNAAGGTITIASGLMPHSTIVNSTGTYTFVGGPIAGGDLTVFGPGPLNLSAATTYTGPAINGAGTLAIPLGGGANVKLNYDMSTFTGTLALSGGMATVTPYYSPSFVSPTGGTIKLEGNTTLYLGWEGYSLDTTVALDTSADNGEGYGVLRGDNATLNGAVVLGANSTIGSVNGTLTINAEIGDGGMGYGFTKVANGTVLLTAANTYTGSTTVSAGTLQCNAPAALGSGPLTINSGGAKANLNYTGTKSVAALVLGGVAQADGSYGSLTSDASFKSGYFQGVGTVTVGDPATFATITSFGANVSGSAAAIGAVAANAADVDFYVSAGTDLATLAPEFVLSPGATCSDQTSGAIPSPGFDAGPVVYTVVSQDTTVTNVYTVTVTVLPVESTLLWDLAVDGEWNYINANWKGQSSGLPALFLDGADVIFDKAVGGLITVAVPLDVTVSPGNMTVNPPAGTTYRWAGGKGKIGGAGTLTKSGDGVLRIGQSDTGPPTIPMLNTFSGGTIINGGELRLEPTSNTGLGTGPITLNGGTFRLERITAANALTVNGGSIFSSNGWGNNWNGPVTLNFNLIIQSANNAKLTINGVVSGAGGLTLNGPHPVVLGVANSYTGPTSVTACTLECKNMDALGSGALTIASTANSKVNLNYSGTKNIASLTLGGVAQTVPGTYGTVASGADYPDDTYFSGTGTVTVGGGSGYVDWATLYAGGATAPAGGDYNNDGVQNGIAYFMGMNGLATNPGVVDGKVTWPHVGAVTSFEVQVSDNLGTWVPAAAGDVDTTSAPGFVIYTLPPGAPQKFCRLTVTP